MSGHSKWSKIKRQKGVSDTKKGQLFTKLGRELMVAVREGGADPERNFRLRLAIQKCRDNNMPMDNVSSAIKKASGETGGSALVETTFEGYGPGGAAILVQALTDNRNRTGPEIKRIFEKHGGSLGNSGCVNWMFSKKGLITVNIEGTDEDQLMEIALNAGADDMEAAGDVFEITCDPGAYEQLKQTLQEKEIPTEVAEISMVPQNTIDIGEEQIAKRIISLMEAFDDHDDVQNAYANFDISEEIMAKIS